ncbi:hypothetical protein BWQ96_01798 [Gracilariopsis chorda]|uniref:Uncharacterized protein n=1 Tax=Gracilariopsis chorda TaxID=448386 RepID=A0A2V3J1R7_9FLOR|nr:hypothetical protein BWQ96_01798 [Gracilariopsis chorda]|eukprot:PXF48338.1 hypothetical protein BWQ96_01798 [Gracilariopsis chorda]
MQGDRLGDLHMLKELVELLQANIIRYQTEAVSKCSQIKHAKIVAGILDNRDNIIHIKKVAGKPKYFRARTFNSAKNRAASMRSASRHHRVPCDKKDRNKSSPPQRYCDDPGPKKGRTDYSRLTRKSSAHLRRLHSAGAVLIRKLSKSSVPAQQQPPTCRSDRPTPRTPILDAETIKMLKTNPMPIINEFQQELQAIEQEELLNRAKLQEADAQLNERRETHEEIIEILDQFYGALPGWEQDPISQKMILETVELTEAGVDAERDLIEAREVCLRAKAALSDHERAQRALQAIRVDLTSFIQILRDLIASADVIVETRRRTSTDSSRRRYSVDVQTEAGEGVLDTLCQLERLLDRCVGQARMAVECCSEAPRVESLRDDLEQIATGFGLEAKAVKKNNTIYYDDLEPTLQVSVTALGDCKLAEAFVSERKDMIAEDVKPLRDQVERCEEYVILERLAILDLRHPRDDR